MKKIIFTLVIAAMGTWYNGYSQCEVSNLAVELESATEVPGGCQVVFNFSWDQEANAGNKYAYIHLWRTDQYPDLSGNDLAYEPASNCPSAIDLTNALGTIVINENGSATPYIGNQYHPEIEAPVLYTGLTVNREVVNSELVRMTVSNITLTIPSCTGVGITGDIWASQAANGSNVHCLSAGVTMVVGNPRVTGLLFCQLPRRYSVQISNVGDASMDVTYNVYIDEGDGYYEPTSHDLKITATPMGPYTIAAGTMFQSGIQSYLPYSNTKPYSDRGLWVEVTEVGTSHKTVHYIANSCIPLPVNMLSFSARRDDNNVALAWETGTEADCDGYEIQRRIGAGEFTSIAFVPTKAPGGNSQSLLRYTYFDNNPVKSVSEYRIKQKDLDGKYAFSEIRYVRGMSQDAGILIYPNPTVNGQVNVIFDETGRKDINLLDNSGRLIRQWRSFNGSNLQISNLRPGSYLVRIVGDDGGFAVTKKFEVVH